MRFQLTTAPFHELETEALVVPLLADVSPNRVRGLDDDLAELITKLNHHGDWRGEPNEVGMFYPSHLASARKSATSGVKRIILAGMGTKANWAYEQLRQAVASAVRLAKKRQVSEATILLPAASTPATAKDLATIVVMATYEFSHYQTLERDRAHEPVETIYFWLAEGKHVAEYQDAIQKGLVIGQAVNYVRDLANHPANVMTPRHLAADARELAGPDVRVTIFGEKELEEKKMGALLAVARGSQEEPQLIVVDYHPAVDSSLSAVSTSPTVAFVGKGITFDSGGISIKPADGMEEMKIDMAGAATCLGVIAAAKALQLPVRIVAVLPTAENLPSGTATKPGDIVTAYDGKTIEILNTDAEGRVVLADGLAYVAKDIQPEAVIDLATLTGAAIVAFGHELAPIFGNAPALMKQLEAAAGRTGELVCPIPLLAEHKKATRSEVADVQNVGLGRRNAALTTAAAFLSYFVPDELPWVHIDIAGPGILEKASRPYYSKGGSGWGVRLLVDLLEHWPAQRSDKRE